MGTITAYGGHYRTQIVGGFTIHGSRDISPHMEGINICGLLRALTNKIAGIITAYRRLDHAQIARGITWHIQEFLPCMDHRNHYQAYTGGLTIRGSRESLPCVGVFTAHRLWESLPSVYGSFYCTRIAGGITTHGLWEVYTGYVQGALLHADHGRHYRAWMGGFTTRRSQESLLGMY